RGGARCRRSVLPRTEGHRSCDVVPQRRADGNCSHHGPYPLYQRLRERDPIHRSRAIRGWFLFRHADCLAVLRDGRFSADDRNYAGYAQQRAWEIADGLADPNQPDEPPMLRRDPPDHTRLRKLVSKAFTPRALERLRPRVEELADRLLTPLSRCGEFD